MSIPGYVDLQVNGHIGIDFSSPDLTKDKIISATGELRKQETVAFFNPLRLININSEEAEEMFFDKIG